MDNRTMEALQAAVLPWAKENKPDAYKATIGVAGQPKKFEAYLLRLLELRWEEDVEGRPGLPILALAQTSLTIKVMMRTGPLSGQMIEFHGMKSKQRTKNSFWIEELLMERSEWESFHEARTTLDLEYF